MDTAFLLPWICDGFALSLFGAPEVASPRPALCYCCPCCPCFPPTLPIVGRHPLLHRLLLHHLQLSSSTPSPFHLCSTFTAGTWTTNFGFLVWIKSLTTKLHTLFGSPPQSPLGLLLDFSIAAINSTRPSLSCSALPSNTLASQHVGNSSECSTHATSQASHQRRWLRACPCRSSFRRSAPRRLFSAFGSSG